MSNTLSNRPEVKNSNFLEKIKANAEKILGALALTAVIAVAPGCAAEAQPAKEHQSVNTYVLPEVAQNPAIENEVIQFNAEQGLRYEREIGGGSIVQSLIDHVNEIDPTAHADWDTQEVALETDAKKIEADYRKLFDGLVQPDTRITLYKDTDTGLWHAYLNDQSDTVVE